MGASPISYTEIKSYSDITGTYLSAWDAGMLRHLSCAYVDQYNISKDPRCPSPYEEVMSIQDKRKAVISAFENFGKRD